MKWREVNNKQEALIPKEYPITIDQRVVLRDAIRDIRHELGFDEIEKYKFNLILKFIADDLLLHEYTEVTIYENGKLSHKTTTIK